MKIVKDKILDRIKEITVDNLDEKVEYKGYYVKKGCEQEFDDLLMMENILANKDYLTDNTLDFEQKIISRINNSEEVNQPSNAEKQTLKNMLEIIDRSKITNLDLITIYDLDENDNILIPKKDLTSFIDLSKNIKFEEM